MIRLSIGFSILYPDATRGVNWARHAAAHAAALPGGVFLLAIDSDLPVVPVSVAGSRHVMLKGRLMTCPGHVRVTVHTPIETAGLTRYAITQGIIESGVKVTLIAVELPGATVMGRPADVTAKSAVLPPDLEMAEIVRSPLPVF